MTDILVVGGAGYIGSHCCKLLSSKGYNPVVLDNFSTGSRRLAKWGTLVQGNLDDPRLLESIFQSRSIRAVMHFAAVACVGESVQDPAKYYSNNVAATLVLLRTMLEHGVKNFIFSSSSAVYGTPSSVPITEDHPKRPINPYGRSKLMVEQMLEDFDRAYGFPYVSLRYFNAAGADEEGDIGEIHQPETHLIPLVFHTALGIRDHLEIYGTDYPTPDGTCIRDFVHVCDLAWAHLLALEWLLEGKPSRTFNLGNEKGYSVREIVEQAGKVCGRPIKVKETSRRPGDPPVLVSSSEQIKKNLGWRPRFAGIQQILETAWRWHRNLAQEGV